MASAIASTAAASGSTRVAVVTGANKGIGFCIAQQLVASEQFGRVILACRNERLAQEAAGKLGLGASTVTVECAPLDLGDPNSVDAFAAHVRSAAVGRLDVLMNNGAIAFKGSDPTPFRDQTEPTLRVNYFGTARLTDALLPLLRETGENPQVVSVASMAGKLGQIKSAELRGGFASESLTREKLDALVESFAAAVQAGDHQRKGWGNSNYGFSKLALIAYTKMVAREEQLARQEGGRFVKVNCCCPGYCATDMSSHRGHRSAEDGARNAVILALQGGGQGALTGEFIQDYQVGSW